MADPREIFRVLKRPFEVRLLHLDDGNSGDPLTGRLEQVTLDMSPPYEALSYEWASPEKTCAITVNSFDFRITQSLHDALQDLRRNTRLLSTRILWADAICINQNDQQELAAQVQIMGLIYRQATRVVTYIGPGGNDTSSALALAKELNDKAEAQAKSSFMWGDLARPRTPEKAIVDDARWPALREMIFRTWSTRCWCAQEFLLNRELSVVCGREVLPSWDLISSLVQHAVNRDLAIPLPTAKEDPLSVTDCLLSLMQLRRGVMRRETTPTLHQLLHWCHMFQASDPRDKVYSVLGLASDRSEFNLTVDYSCTVEVLYCKIAAEIVQRSQTIDILYSCLHEKSLDLPSWVPDWSSWRKGSRAAAFAGCYNACGSTEDEVCVDGLRVHVGGCLVDKIVYLSEPIGKYFVSLDENVTERKNFITTNLMEILKRSQLLGRGSNPHDTLWRTLIGNMSVYETLADEKYAKLFNAHLAYKGEASPEKTRTAAREFLDATRRRSRFRRLAITEKGFVGGVAQNAEINDCVSMLQGRKLLFVLRPQGPNFEYIGHAYVHGLMDGEILRQPWYAKRTLTLV